MLFHCQSLFAKSLLLEVSISETTINFLDFFSLFWSGFMTVEIISGDYTLWISSSDSIREDKIKEHWTLSWLKPINFKSRSIGRLQNCIFRFFARSTQLHHWGWWGVTLSTGRFRGGALLETGKETTTAEHDGTSGFLWYFYGQRKWVFLSPQKGNFYWIA